MLDEQGFHDAFGLSPNPAALLSSNGAILAANHALRALGERLLLETRDLMPADTPAVAAGCVKRAVSAVNVEARLPGGRELCWTFAPTAESGVVIATATDVTAERHSAPAVADLERRYRMITAHTTDLISRHREDGTFVYASPAALPLLGFTPDELIGISSYDLFHPDDLRALLGKEPSVLYERGFYRVTYRIRRKTGEYTWFETTSRTLRDPDTGKIQEIFCLSRDVTRRVEAEEELKRLARVIEATPDVVLFTSRDGEILYRNEAGRQLVDPAADEAGAAILDDLFDAADLRTLHERALPRAEARGAWQGDLTLKPRSGPTMPASLVVLANRGHDGAVEYYSLIMRDLRERLRAEEQARQLHKELAHAARLSTMGEMATSLAHELNQPLATIVNYAQGSLRRLDGAAGLPPDALRGSLERVTERANHAAELIRRIRRYARKSPLQASPLDANELARETADFCRWEAERNGVVLSVATAQGLPRFLGDPVHVQQVLINLIRNGVDAATDRDDGAKWVRVESIADEQGRVGFRVTDSGPGIQQQPLEAVFEPFHTTKPDGLGMGLSISRSIVETAGGILRVANMPDGGACFTCLFPLYEGFRDHEQGDDESCSS